MSNPSTQSPYHPPTHNPPIHITNHTKNTRKQLYTILRTLPHQHTSKSIKTNQPAQHLLRPHNQRHDKTLHPIRTPKHQLWHTHAPTSDHNLSPHIQNRPRTNTTPKTQNSRQNKNRPQPHPLHQNRLQQPKIIIFNWNHWLQSKPTHLFSIKKHQLLPSKTKHNAHAQQCNPTKPNTQI